MANTTISLSAITICTCWRKFASRRTAPCSKRIGNSEYYNMSGEADQKGNGLQGLRVQIQADQFAFATEERIGGIDVVGVDGSLIQQLNGNDVPAV